MSLSVHLRSAAPGNFPQLILESVNQDGERGGGRGGGPPLPPVTMTTAVDGGRMGGSGAGGGSMRSLDRCC